MAGNLVLFTGESIRHVHRKTSVTKLFYDQVVLYNVHKMCQP
jgi:hypothetical protein